MNAEVFARLEKAGHTIGETWIREDSKVLISVDGVFMFWRDLVDLAEGLATVEQIKQRNKGKVFPRPHKVKP
jgi:hypothetical protein